MAETRTAEELRDKAASILKKKVAGEALGAEAAAVIEDNIDGVIDEIANIVVIDKDEIPSRYFLTLARILAIHSASDFENVLVDYDSVQRHEMRLRYLAAQQPGYAPSKGEYM